MTNPTDAQLAEWIALAKKAARGLPRPSVVAFAYAMEERLRANEHKGGWQNMREEDLIHRCLEELQELQSELFALTKNPGRIRREAADVGNFAFFIADNYGALKRLEPLGTCLLSAFEGQPTAAKALLAARALLRVLVAKTVPDDPWCMVPKAWLDKARAALGEKA